MIRLNLRRGSIAAARSGGTGRPDLAMNVLQYGTAIVAIVVVTLLAVLR